MKKLLIVNIATGFGGAEKSLLDVIKNLKNEYEINYIEENSGLIDLLKKEKIKVVPFKTGSLKKISGIFKYFFALIRLIFLVLKIKPDLIISNTVRSHILASPVAFILKRKLIWILRDYQFNKKVKKVFEIFPKKIICVSKDLEKFYKGNNEKYLVIPNGIEIVKFIYSNEINTGDKKNGGFKLAIASNFARLKGLEYLIGAVKSLNNEDLSRKIELLIVGGPNNSDSEKYYEEIKKLVNADSNIKFLGWQKDIFSIFRGVDAIVSSTTTSFGGPEAFGRTILEAWLLQKPIIATNVGGSKELVEHMFDGILVEEKNVEQMKEAIKKLAENKALCLSLGKRGYSKLRKNFSLDTITLRYKELIDEIIY